jgi:hypothetical protein
MTERTPAEIIAIDRLHQDFLAAIANAEGVDRQIVLDALEFTLHCLLVECFDGRDTLDAYWDVMRDRGLGMWRLRNDGLSPCR